MFSFMETQFSRTQSLIGEEALQKLASSRVAVFGLGGVGGYAVEALARSGVGALDLIDGDDVSLTNLNRQILATHNTIGLPKAEVARARVLEINPDCKAAAHRIFYLPETAQQLNFSDYDYIIDAIDTVTGKLAIIERANACGVPVVSCMGAGNKLDAAAFEIADIFQTSVCPLAKVMRRELKKRGIEGLKVVYSKEEPIKAGTEGEGKKPVPASIAFVPSVAGLLLAGEVIKDLTGL